MTDKKEDPKGKTLARQMAEEFVAALNRKVMEEERERERRKRDSSDLQKPELGTGPQQQEQ